MTTQSVSVKPLSTLPSSWPSGNAISGSQRIRRRQRSGGNVRSWFACRTSLSFSVLPVITHANVVHIDIAESVDKCRRALEDSSRYLALMTLCAIEARMLVNHGQLFRPCQQTYAVTTRSALYVQSLQIPFVSKDVPPAGYIPP